MGHRHTSLSVPNPAIFVATGGWALIDAWYRLAHGTRPFDWLMFWLDMAILAVSIAGIVITWLAWKRYGVRKCKKAIRGFMVRGRDLLSHLPMGSADAPDWTTSVDQLIQDAATYLEKHSPDALAVFLDTTNMASRITPGLVGVEEYGHYARLTLAMKNLRSIMENAGEYFQ